MIAMFFLKKIIRSFYLGFLAIGISLATKTITLPRFTHVMIPLVASMLKNSEKSLGLTLTMA